MTDTWLFALGFAAGLALIFLGADAVVRGSAALARSFQVSPFTVGLTIVAFGGSVPELAIGAIAAARGHGPLAIGNVVGSNIANLAFILGLCATLRSVPVRRRLFSREIPFMVGSAMALAVVVLDQRVGRAEGALLLAAFAGFLWHVLALARREPSEVEGAYERAVVEIEREAGPPDRRTRAAASVALGAGGLFLGAQLLVAVAAYLAERLGVSESVVGVTVVALGTSLPELVTSLVAVLRRQADLALGNIIGSNVFNVFAILGLASLIRPLDLDAALLRLEVPFLVVLSIVFLPLASTSARIERWEGALLVLAHAAFVWLVILRIAG